MLERGLLLLKENTIKTKEQNIWINDQSAHNISYPSIHSFIHPSIHCLGRLGFVPTFLWMPQLYRFFGVCYNVGSLWSYEMSPARRPLPVLLKACLLLFSSKLSCHLVLLSPVEGEIIRSLIRTLYIAKHHPFNSVCHSSLSLLQPWGRSKFVHQKACDLKRLLPFFL